MALFVLPPLVQFLINQYGWNGALLITAGLVANGATCGALYRPSPLELEIRNKAKILSFVESSSHGLTGKNNNHRINTSKETILENVPANRARFKRRESIMVKLGQSTDTHLLKNAQFMSLFMAYFLHGGGYLIVISILTPHAVNIGISKFLAAFLVSMIGITSVITRLTYGYLLDYKLTTATKLTAVANLLNALCCIMHPLTHSHYGYLATVSAIFGVSSAVSNSILPIIAQEYVGVQQVSGAVSYLLAAQGFGAVLATVTSGMILGRLLLLAFFLTQY